jgi:hypothetical protein
MIGKVNQDFEYTFGVKTSSGAPRTGLGAGDFTVTVRNPQDTASSNPSVSEVGGGMYRFTIPAAFTTTHGAGEYGITVELTTAPIDLAGDTVPFFVNSLDDISGGGGGCDCGRYTCTCGL